MIKRILANGLLFFIVIMLLVSCKKEVENQSLNQKIIKATAEIRKIVGEKATISLYTNYDSVTSEHLQLNEKKDIISIEQLNEIYSVLKDKPYFVCDSLQLIQVNEKFNNIRSNSIKSFDETEGPIVPGVYRATFKGPTFLYSTTIIFSIGMYGQVTGNPSLSISTNYFYNPYTFTTTYSSPIVFNPFNSTSQFTIMGNLTMNVGVGNFTFTVISREIQYNITIDADSGIVGLK